MHHTPDKNARLCVHGQGLGYIVRTLNQHTYMIKSLEM